MERLRERYRAANERAVWTQSRRQMSTAAKRTATTKNSTSDSSVGNVRGTLELRPARQRAGAAPACASSELCLHGSYCWSELTNEEFTLVLRSIMPMLWTESFVSPEVSPMIERQGSNQAAFGAHDRAVILSEATVTVARPLGQR